MTSTKKNILILNGPNLNKLGSRQPEIYGNQTLDDIEQLIHKNAESLQLHAVCQQTNHEGEMIDFIQDAPNNSIDAIIINAAAFTHTSVAIRDALLTVDIPFIEVHLSNVHRRETFRQHSYLADIAVAVISGLKEHGYIAALEFFAKN